MIDPAVQAANRAGAYARDAMHGAQERARDAMHGAQERFSREYTRAEHFASEQYDRTGRWVSSHPFKAVGIALVVGLAISTLFESSSSKRYR